MQHYIITRERALDSVGSGWATLVHELYNNLPDDVHVIQVKEKFAGLRVYVEGNITDMVEDLIYKLEETSYTMCEYCGKSASAASNGYWIKTVCDDHLNDRTRLRKNDNA